MAGGRGYWGDQYPIFESAIMIGPGRLSKSSWMSLTPVEIESQKVGVLGARGHTVVLGLGMGWAAANVALRPEVDRVTVVERDPDVIALIRAQGLFEALPPDARAKLAVVEADALTWRPDSPVHSLQADIWLGLAEDGKLADVRQMQSNIGAEQVYFWGQEMEIWRQACRHTGGAPALDRTVIRRIVEEDLGLPLILPEWPDLPEKLASAGTTWAPLRTDWWHDASGTG
ncbi:hypothetical protein NUH88_16020 [Nisaea acidiphila]|uniref:Spermidine synthase n=1 Tax=Nisaea acidiphila TaxID=1862145 RepID=A0A9J7APQ8_9PROT|nr:hypothetical protein [Nisaea acidiphila]UUX48898.1 hypothetical protein NUH88_16020 [Nisaea acidiphila]